MWIELLLLTIIVCFVVDISGFIYTIKNLIWKWVFNGKKEYREFRLKPFDCSLCMSWWVGLIWIIIYDFSLLNLFIVCVFVTLSEEITNTLLIIKYLIHKVGDAIQSMIEKIKT